MKWWSDPSDLPLKGSIDEYWEIAQNLGRQMYDDCADDIDCGAECEENEVLYTALEEQGYALIYSSGRNNDWDLYADQAGQVLAVYDGPCGPMNFFVDLEAPHDESIAEDLPEELFLF